MTQETGGKQLLHLVFGGELEAIDSTQFRDLNKLDIVGIFPDYKSAHVAWKAKAQATGCANDQCGFGGGHGITPYRWAEDTQRSTAWRLLIK